MDRSRLDARTVGLALLCVAVLAFAAATLTTTTSPESNFGVGDIGGNERGFEGTPTAATDPGERDDGQPSFLDIEGGVVQICVAWLARPLVQAGLLLGMLAIFLVGRWYDDAMMGLAWAFLVGYPAFFAYLLLTSCRTGKQGLLPSLSPSGRPTSPEAGGILGGQGSVTSPTMVTQLLLVLVIGLLGVVAVVVLTGDHEQLDAAESGDDEADETAPDRADVAAIGAAAGRAADRIEGRSADEFENEVYRAWAEMTDPLSVDHPESSTPAEFATAAVEAGMAPGDVDRLTGLFEAVRYGGADPTAEREREAVETLRRIEAAYAAEDAGGAGS